MSTLVAVLLVAGGIVAGFAAGFLWGILYVARG